MRRFINRVLFHRLQVNYVFLIFNRISSSIFADNGIDIHAYAHTWGCRAMGNSWAQGRRDAINLLFMNVDITTDITTCRNHY